MRLILVRHGQTSSNVGQHLDTAVPGADLTDLGREQAEALVDALGRESVRRIFVSDLVRTQQTAAPLAEHFGLEPTVRASLREISAGDLEMANDEESIQTYVRTAVGWSAGDWNARVPGSEENGHDVIRRFDAVVSEAAHGPGDGEVAILVSHGAIIRAWTAARCENVDVDFVAHNALSNTGAVVIEGSDERWVVTHWQEQALGGAPLEDPATDGAAADPVR
ncbi:histidine phosphatase family protein [Kocuria gwangalliensis]|uniref:Histidine phosphatase family protein n=1 Tax=Kocuria gwangalliensis TaxID=501592 RepID=A0ABP8WJ46_9MICC|nr:histidine phosphatase family protein [Kocuria sp.]